MQGSWVSQEPGGGAERPGRTLLAVLLHSGCSAVTSEGPSPALTLNGAVPRLGPQTPSLL